MKHIMIMGARGFTRNYGGWETFVKNLVYNWKDEDVQFYVSEIVHNKNEEKVITVDNVICPQIYTKETGHATMVLFAFKSLLWFLKYVKEEKLKNVIFYVIGVRLGPVYLLLRNTLEKIGIKVIINPDGLEWKREKWNWLVKQYFKISEATMIKSSDYVVCDSMAIEQYVIDRYKNNNSKTKYISYGSYPVQKQENNENAERIFKKHVISIGNYYLIVGRFVPENNYELIIREFMKSKTKKDLVIISNVENNSFYNHLLAETKFNNDSRIKFVGTVYDKKSLEFIRYNAFAYLHGHSAGGTNPSLLEAMSTTNLNLLYEVTFNKEVGQDAALYFNSQNNNLSSKIDDLENISQEYINDMGIKAKNRMGFYTWEKVVSEHEKLFKEMLE